MVETLTEVSVVLVALSAVTVIVLASRRVLLGRAGRRQKEREAALRPLALTLIDGDHADVDLGAADRETLADILGRYALQVRGTAAERIAEFFEQAGEVDRQLELLKARRPWRRATAAQRLGEVGARRAGPGLIDALNDPDREVRAAAARSLGKLGCTEAADPLVAALGCRSVPAAVAGHALLALGPAALPDIRALAGDEDRDPDERAAGIRLLAELGDASDAGRLEAALTDTSADVRAAAAEALSGVGGAEAAVLLTRALGDRIPLVRRAAADALGALGARSAVPPLLARASDDDFETAAAAARSSAKIDPAAVLSAARERGAGPHLAEAADRLALGGRTA